MKTHLYRVVFLRGRVEKGMPGMLAAGQRPHKPLVLWEAILGETVSSYATETERRDVLGFTSPTTKRILDAEMPSC